MMYVKTKIDPDALASFLAGHELSTDYGYEEQACSCGRWSDDGPEDDGSYHAHLVEEAIAWNDRIDKGEG